MSLAQMISETMGTMDERDSLTILRHFVASRESALFQELVRRHRELVLRSSLRVVGNAADAEDAAQETFIRLARNAHKVDTCVESWLAMCATNCGLEILRAKKRRQQREQRFAEMEARRREEQQMEQLRPVVDACLSRLGPDDRDLLVNYYLRGQTMRHIGRDLGVDAATVKRRLDRAKGTLRERLRCQASGAANHLLIAWLVPLPLLFVYYRFRYGAWNWRGLIRRTVFG